ncbi:hypothetical protein [Telmatospirillum sp.]|uniref:hypothetical protein n=1 Tax=Telmatospirillum sp. TaxID=2079197 RepID=UPI0028505999|nr:hypothetical protein [Telmatospirillum sp.]MDR3438996.1 hypothetical protein [Telmatospirillum sp.]
MPDLRRLDWILEKAELGESKLSVWERNFVDDLGRRHERQGGLTLSERQWEIPEAVAEKAA